MTKLVSENPQIGLVVQGLRKSYQKKAIIRDVSLSVKRGEVVALLGPNGSGKTTSFYAIAGLIQADGGKVSLDGNDISALPMYSCLLYTSPSPRDNKATRMPSSA